MDELITFLRGRVDADSRFSGTSRWLLEVESKQRIIDLLCTGELGRRDEQLLRLLALPYRDHPDYQETWLPLD